MSGAIRVPNAVAPLHVSLDLRAGTVSCHVDLDAPKDGRPTTRVNWLVRQLKQAPDNVRLEAFAAYARGNGSAALLRDVRENPALLVESSGKEIRSFRVALSMPLGPKRGRGRGCAIDSVLDTIEGFYGTVLGELKAWSGAPPKLRDEPRELVEPPVDVELVSTSLSSQDEPTDAPPSYEAVRLAVGPWGIDHQDDAAPAEWTRTITNEPDGEQTPPGTAATASV
jgi:hypothetical protein